MSRSAGTGWYRIYFLDKDDHIRRAVNIEATSDKDAVAAAQDQNHPFKVEIWQGPHLIGTIEGGAAPG